MYLIELFTWFSAAKIITTKEKNGVTDAIFEIYFGQPRKFLADNGVEFANEVYKELCEQFNIELQLLQRAHGQMVPVSNIME